MAEEWQRDEYTISTDPARIDLALVHDFLRQSYWAEGIPLAIVERSIRHPPRISPGLARPTHLHRNSRCG